eukprot:scaffold21574_cov80-Skeletonema_marinoi.AAC.1
MSERVNHQLFEKPREYEKQSNGEGILRVTGRPAQRFADSSDCMRGTARHRKTQSATRIAVRSTLPIAFAAQLCIWDLQSRYRVYLSTLIATRVAIYKKSLRSPMLVK